MTHKRIDHVSGNPLFGGVTNETFGDVNLYIGRNHLELYPGSGLHDLAFGRGGSDFLLGRAMDDDLLGGEGSDLLWSGAGMDHLDGGDGDDAVIGGDDADGLRGDDGHDYLNEGVGHGDLGGGMGDDTLDGGDGADAFIVSPDSGNDVVVAGFDAGPGAFDHLALRDITPDQVTVEDTTQQGETGVLVSWNTDEDTEAEGSIFLVGLSKIQMAQDDFMFNADDAREGGFISDDAITSNGSLLIFQSQPVSTAATANYDLL